MPSLRPLVAAAVVSVSATVAHAQPSFAAAPASPGTAAAAAASAESAMVTTFATLPTTGATDNICQSPDGTIYVSLLDEHRLIKVAADGKVTPFADPAGVMHLLGIACPANNEIVAVAYAKTGTATRGEVLGFSDTGSHVLVFDATGKQTADIRVSANVGLNGISGLGAGIYFAADSNSGSIYRLDLASKRAEVWFKDDAYGPTAGVSIGINGVKARKDWVYFSAPARMGIYKIQVSSDGKPQGTPVKIEEGLRADDFDVAANGDVYFPVATTLYKVAAAGGEPVRFVDPIPPGPSALVGSDQKWVYWPTRSATGHARIVRAPLS